MMSGKKPSNQISDNVMIKKIKPNEIEENVTSELHGFIKKGDMEAVKNYVETHLDVKSSCSFSNESALMVALNMKQIRIYSYLQSKGFSYGEGEEFKELIDKWSVKEQQELRNTYAQYYQSIESPHVLDLLRNSWLHFNNDIENFRKVQEFYGDLDKIPEIQPLLQVVANAENFRIVFDFNSDSTCGLNPTEFNESVRGETFYYSGVINIGAKRDKTDVLGTLAHELAHYAMQLIYENDAQPYFQDDQNQTEKKYDEILKNYIEMKNHDPLIDIAIKYIKPVTRIIELIVRVPHLIALYSSKPELTELRCRYKELFDFYETNVLPDLRNEFPLMIPKRKIQELNKLLAVHKEYEEASNFTCVESKLEIFGIQDEEQNFLVTTEVPKLVFANLIMHLKQTSKKIESSFIFIGIDQLMDSKYHVLINKAFHSAVKPKMFVLNSSEILENAKEIEKLIAERLSKTRIVLVSNYKFKLREKFPIRKDIALKWGDLEKTSQNEILNWKVEFQGHNDELKKIVSERFFHKSSLKDIFKLKELKIDAPKYALKDSEIYIDRTFKNKLGLTISCEEVLEEFWNNRVLIIANEAGMGKTTIARYFAKVLLKAFQSCWVLFIDLKEHTKNYFKDEQPNQHVVDIKFLITILNLQGDLEVELFKHFYETGNMVFILDGFDEISPKFKECLLKIIDIMKDSNNRLMITTRTHLSRDLEDHLKAEALKLNSLEIKDGIKLLTMLLRKRREDENDGGVDDFFDEEKKADLLYNKFNHSLWYVRVFDSPLLVKMISELDEDDLKVFNVYTLYKRFVEKKIEIWMKKGPLATDDNVKLLMNRTDIIQIHHEMALQLLLDDEVFKSLQIQKSEIDQEQITRFGLLYFDGEDFQFTHRSFAEYFLANFLILNLNHGTIFNSSEKFNTVLLTIMQPGMFLVEQRFVETHLKETKNSLIGKLTVNFTIKQTRRFISCSIYETLSNFLYVILSNLNINDEQKLDLFEYPFQLAKGPKRNLFHLWATVRGTIDTFFVLSDWAETFVSHEKLNEMFFNQKDEHGETPFYITMLMDTLKKNTWESLLRRVSGSLSTIDFKTFLLERNERGVIYLHGTSSEVFPLIWNSDEVTLDDVDRKKLMSEPGQKGFNFLMSALRRNKEKLVDCVLNEAEKRFSTEELSKYLASESEDNETCLHIAASFSDWKIFENLWNFFKKSFDDSRLKSFLMKKNFSGQIMSLILARKNRQMHNFVEDFLNFHQDLKLISEKEKESFLSRIQSDTDEFNNRFNGIDNILEHLYSGLSKKKATEFIKFKMENGETCLHIAARASNLDKFKLVWNFVKETFDEEEQMEILYETFWHNRDFYFYGSKSGDRLVYEEISNICLKINKKGLLRSLSTLLKYSNRYQPFTD